MEKKKQESHPMISMMSPNAQRGLAPNAEKYEQSQGKSEQFRLYFHMVVLMITATALVVL